MINRALSPETKVALNKFKMVAAREVGVDPSQDYIGDLTSRTNVSVSRQMIKKWLNLMKKNYNKKIFILKYIQLRLGWKIC